MGKIGLYIVLAIQVVTHSVKASYTGPQYVYAVENTRWASMSPAQRLSENEAIFARFCIGRADSTEIPHVNYKNESVMQAALRLSRLEYNAFYFYSGPARAYGLRTKEYDLYRDLSRNVFVWVEDGVKPPKDIRKQIESGELKLVSSDKKKRVWYDPRKKSKPSEVTDPAHALLVQLCGEFRDRATMIEAKINWYNRIIPLPVKDQKFDPKGDMWSQFSANDYSKYLTMSAQGWQAKRAYQSEIEQKSVSPLPQLIDGVDLGVTVQLLNAGRWVKIGNETHDVPVPAMTICESKYMQSEYIRKDENPWSSGDIRKSVPKYFEGLAKFQKSYCSKADVSYFYDFRGDSNIKQYSPEANGMIWHASSVSAKCSSATQSAPDCANYFRRPFTSRWNAARAGAATWLTYARENEASFRNDSSMVAVFPFHGSEVRHVDTSREPYAYSFDVNSQGGYPLDRGLDTAWKKISNAFGLPSLGLIEMTDYKSEDGRYFVFNRLRNAVNRHTNWYQSGYNDGRGLQRVQAYSPFVASSYEPHESNAFTAPGYTVQGDADGRKYLMYVFRVPIANWVHSLTIKSGGVINFDTAWLDETSLGDTALAEAEKAFDRLGTALEGEFDSILYLHNIQHETGSVSQTEAPIVYSN